MLIARSSPECHLYIALHPCECGAAWPPASHRLVSHGNHLIALYSVACPRCGRARRFELTLHPDLPPPPPAFGGPSPSTIICPGEFLGHAERLARAVPATPDARHAPALAEAIAALDEVLKFIPDGADQVPAAALTSVAGKERYLAEPGRFHRRRLEAVREAYRALLAPARQ